MNLNDSPCPMNLKELSSLSKPPNRINDQDNMNSKDENERMKPVTVKVNSFTSIRSKSNDGHLQSDQFGGQKKNPQFVKHTFTEFLGNKKCARWIPY